MKKENTEHEIFDPNYEFDNEHPNEEKGLTVVDQDFQLPTVSVENIDALDDAEVAPISLKVDYWSPATPGESKRVIFQKIGTTQVLNQATGELIDLESAFFATKENGVAKMICNGARRLVGQIQGGKIAPGTPLLITYKGKVRNKSNGFMSDDWDCSPLLLKR